MDAFAQAYHWTWDDIFAKTMPQFYMLKHAGWVNKRLTDARVKRNRDSNSVHDRVESAFNDDTPVWNGKSFDELTSEEMAEYYQS